MGFCWQKGRAAPSIGRYGNYLFAFTQHFKLLRDFVYDMISKLLQSNGLKICPCLLPFFELMLNVNINEGKPVHCLSFKHKCLRFWEGVRYWNYSYTFFFFGGHVIIRIPSLLKELIHDTAHKHWQASVLNLRHLVATRVKVGSICLGKLLIHLIIKVVILTIKTTYSVGFNLGHRLCFIKFCCIRLSVVIGFAFDFNQWNYMDPKK